MPEEEPMNAMKRNTSARTKQTQVREAIAETRQFHQSLATLYEDAKGEVHDAKVRMVLEHLAEHEQWVVDSIKQYEGQAQDTVLESWFKYAPQLEGTRLALEAKMTPGITPDELAEGVRELTDTVTGLFEKLADSTNAPEVEEALTNLANLEKQAQIRAMRSTELE